MDIQDFYVGQKVKSVGGQVGWGTVEAIHPSGRIDIRLSDYTIWVVQHNPEMWEPVEVSVQPEPAHKSDWSYAEAERLQKLAHEAIDAYNEYINAKPNTVFLTIFK